MQKAGNKITVNLNKKMSPEFGVNEDIEYSNY